MRTIRRTTLALMVALVLPVACLVAYKWYWLDTRRIMVHEQRRVLRHLCTVYDVYFAKQGFFPAEDTGLNVLESAYGVGATSDLWGNTLRYSLADGRPRLLSAGPDMAFGTSDDIIQ